MSRELDRAVVVAMKWPKGHGLEPALLDLLIADPNCIPYFSTDFAALPEMLAWLHHGIRNRFAGGVCMQCIADKDGSSGGSWWSASQLRGMDDHILANASTLPEAICNLVVAVAAKERS